MINKSRSQQRAHIKTRIRKKIYGTTECPRLTVYRSLHHLYAQVVDDTQRKTLVAASTVSKEIRERMKDVKGRKNRAKQIGIEVAKRALEKKITSVVFDRNGYLYHGVVKSLADGAREAGLKL
ncbi:MAG TPA: 50S ribosomal protein L18 [Bacteroidota bacterium]|nr:50S ribosomal protein L18 [Bacteroidota bacterium]